MKVSILGLGYMGLPMAAVAARAGHDVLGCDVQEHVVTSINAGQAHFDEPGLRDLIQEYVETGRLQAFATPQTAEIHVIAVPTPFVADSKAPDMTYVRAAAKALAAVLRAGDLVILESTSPVGATEREVKAVIEAEQPELIDQVLYAFCPERAIPGNTLRELVANDRCVGGLTEAATAKAIEFYRTFVTGELLPTTTRVAELVKLVENTSRDIQIAFANELNDICEKFNLNVYDVVALANRHPRVNILRPGTGVGGHCIAVDPWFIASAALEDTPLIQQARAINDAKPQRVVQRILALAEEKPTASIALMGLAFKPDVDDLRTSPAVQVAMAVQAVLPAERLVFCEPMLQTHEMFPLSTVEQALTAEICVFLTAHSVFKDHERYLQGKVIYDPAGTFEGRL